MYLNGFEWFIFGVCIVLILSLMNMVAISRKLAIRVVRKRAKIR